jgi:hypothetical protein
MLAWFFNQVGSRGGRGTIVTILSSHIRDQFLQGVYLRLVGITWLEAWIAS